MDWTTVVVSTLTAASAVGVGRAARRSPRQEKRDDFTLITDSLRKDLTDVKTDLASTKTELAVTRREVEEYDALTRWMARWVRACVGAMRDSQVDIPPRPQPEPRNAAEYLHDIGI